MNTLFDVQLTQDQRNLLETIAHPWLDHGEWPLWANVQHYFDMRGQDADAVFHSLPRIGTQTPYGAGYGFTLPMRAPIDGKDRVRLTVAASLVVPQVRMVAGEPFVQALRHMIDLYTSRPMHFNQVPTITLRSGELQSALPHLKPWFVQVLPDLLSNEPAISTGGVGLSDGSWERKVTRSVLQFRTVQSVEDYVERTCEIVMAAAAQYAPAVPVVEELVSTAPEREPYVDPALLDHLEEAAKATKWQVHKLIALCQGLNDAFVAENPYVCAAMIRAVLDHIPPVFGHADFKHVAAQHPFGRTDRAHAANLSAFKAIGDDVMHRPIGPSVPRVSMDDIPRPLRLNAMLHELLAVLRAQGNTQ
ncbi:hypothetical protein RKD21_006596 [Streptomyces albogriseolus]|uniref:Uncharacterized protein n=1 Tax=Streptomyces albogriseolus TaxID=1887 RepID=A0ACC6UXP9_STRAO